MSVLQTKRNGQDGMKRGLVGVGTERDSLFPWPSLAYMIMEQPSRVAGFALHSPTPRTMSLGVFVWSFIDGCQTGRPILDRVGPSVMSLESATSR